MSHTTPPTATVRRVALGLMDDYGLVSEGLLVCMIHAETDADADTIRETIARLEKYGTIYNASGDAAAPEWKVTRP